MTRSSVLPRLHVIKMLVTHSFPSTGVLSHPPFIVFCGSFSSSRTDPISNSRNSFTILARAFRLTGIMEGFGDRAPYGGAYGRDQPRGEGFGDQQRPYYEEVHEGQVGEFAGVRGKYATPQETYEYGKSRDQAELGAGGGGQGAGQAAYAGGSQKMGDEDVYGDEDIEDDDDIDEEEKERRKIKRRERAAKAVAAGAAGYALYERHKVKNLDKDADEREEEEEERRQSEDSGGRKHHWF